MRIQLRNQLLGAAVLTALVVIFIPMIIEENKTVASVPTVFPEQPNRQFDTPEIDNQTIFTPEIVAESTTETTPVLDQNLAAMAAAPVLNQLQNTATKKAAVVKQSETVKEPKITKAKTPPIKKVVHSWVVQVGSFSNRANAVKLVKRLKRNRFEAFLEKIKINHRWLYRVRVGPEINKKLAEKVQRKIFKLINLKGAVVSYP